MRKLLLSFSIFCVSVTTNAQNVDSLMALRKTDFLPGKIPTYYSPGHQQIAAQLQTLVGSAVAYYEKLYGKPFHLKLAVLDTTQWLKEMTPYGFLFYEQGWMVMNTGMAYQNFKQVYGLDDFSSELDKALSAKHITPEETVQAFNAVYAIHEVGHSFFDSLSNSKAPDLWTNEFIATYFSYQYFKNNNPAPLSVFDLFSQIDRDNYQPKHTSIKDLNEIYGNMGVKNYLWYHSNFYFLVKSLYDCYGLQFIPAYETLFPKAKSEKLSTAEIISRFDKQCNGTVAKWVTTLESTPKKP